MSYSTISTQLQVILSGVTSLAKVYGTEPKIIDTFPAASVAALSHTNIFYTLAANERTYRFMVRVFFREDESQDSDYETVMQACIDDLILTVESNVTLNSTCDFAEPTSSQWGYGDVNGVAVRVCEITIEAKVYANR